jgi:hypothetical protein
VVAIQHSSMPAEGWGGEGMKLRITLSRHHQSVAGKQTDTSAESDWGGGGEVGLGGDKVEWQPSTSTGQQKGGGGHNTKNILSLLPSLLQVRLK